MKKYKLTDQNLQTYEGFQWVLGEKQTTSGEGELCGPGFLHYYHHPLLAVLLNPIHANIKDPILFEVEAEGIHLDDNGIKGGCTEMTLIKEIELPVITKEQKIAFGILCAKEAETDKNWLNWADKWLSGEDRTTKSAKAAAAAAYAAAYGVAAAAAAADADATYIAAVFAAVNAAVGANIDLIKIAEESLKY